MARNDPYPLKAKFAGTCAHCGKPIKRGDDCYYWPIGRRIEHDECGKVAYFEFLASIEDERCYRAGWL